MFFLRKTSTIHIQLLFRNVPVKVHELTFLWFGLPGPLLNKLLTHKTFSVGYQPPIDPGDRLGFHCWLCLRTNWVCPGTLDISQKSQSQKIAAFSTRKLQSRKFCCRKSQEKFPRKIAARNENRMPAFLSVYSPALILSKHSGVSLAQKSAKIG